MTKTATAVIDTLTVPQRALLHSALVFFKAHAEEAFAATIVENQTTLFKQFFSYTEKETVELMNVLFADCHINDMDFVKQFNDWYRQKQEDDLINAADSR